MSIWLVEHSLCSRAHLESPIDSWNNWFSCQHQKSSNIVRIILQNRWKDNDQTESRMQQTITAATRLAGSLRQVDVHKFTNLNIVCENAQPIDLCSQSTGNCPCVFELLGSNKLYQMNISSMLKYKLWWERLFFKFKVLGLCSIRITEPT